MAWNNSTLDNVFKDYLVHRGFNQTLKCLESELKQDKTQQVEKIIQQIHYFIYNFEIEALLAYWKHLETCLFTLLEDSYSTGLKKIESNLFRLYIVTCIQNNKRKECAEFFEKLMERLSGQHEWMDWFSIMYLPHPESSKQFRQYFLKQWTDTFFLSLHNFFSVILSCMPPCAIVRMLNAQQNGNHIQIKNESPSTQLNYTDREVTPTTSFIRALGQPCVSENGNSYQPKQKSSFPAKKIFSIKHSSKESKSSKNLPPMEEEQETTPKPEPQSVAPVKKSSIYSSQRSELLGKSTSILDQRRSNTYGFTQAIEKTEIFTTPTTSSVNMPGKEPKDDNNCSTPEKHAPLKEVVSDLFTITSTKSFSEHHTSIAQCSINTSFMMVASCDVDGVVKLWDVSSPTAKPSATVIGKSHFQCLAWVIATDLLLIGASDGLVRLYSSSKRQILQDYQLTCNPNNVNQMKFQPFSSSFATSCIFDEKSNDNMAVSKLSIWTLKQDRISVDTTISHEPNRNITCMCYNEGGTILAFGDSSGNITLYSTGLFKVISTKKLHNGSVNCLQFSTITKKQIYSMGNDGKLKVYDILGESSIVNLPIHSSATGPFEMSGHGGYRQTSQTFGGQLFDFHSKGQHLVTCDGNNAVIYEIDIGKGSLEIVITIYGHRSPIVCVDWTSKQSISYCLSGSMDGQLNLTVLTEYSKN